MNKDGADGEPKTAWELLTQERDDKQKNKEEEVAWEWEEFRGFFKHEQYVLVGKEFGEVETREEKAEVRRIAKMLGAKSFHAHAGDGSETTKSLSGSASADALIPTGTVTTSVSKKHADQKMVDVNQDLVLMPLMADKIIRVMGKNVNLLPATQRRECWMHIFGIPTDVNFFEVTNQLIDDRISGIKKTNVSESSKRKDDLSLKIGFSLPTFGGLSLGTTKSETNTHERSFTIEFHMRADAITNVNNALANLPASEQAARMAKMQADWKAQEEQVRLWLMASMCPFPKTVVAAAAAAVALQAAEAVSESSIDTELTVLFIKEATQQATEASAAAAAASAIAAYAAAVVALLVIPFTTVVNVTNNNFNTDRVLVLGNKVEARYGGLNHWRYATITSIHDEDTDVDATYDLLYDDGREEMGATRIRMRADWEVFDATRELLCGEEVDLLDFAPLPSPPTTASTGGILSGSGIASSSGTSSTIGIASSSSSANTSSTSSTIGIASSSSSVTKTSTSSNIEIVNSSSSASSSSTSSTIGIANTSSTSSTIGVMSSSSSATKTSTSSAIGTASCSSSASSSSSVSNTTSGSSSTSGMLGSISSNLCSSEAINQHPQLASSVRTGRILSADMALNAVLTPTTFVFGNDAETIGADNSVVTYTVELEDGEVMSGVGRETLCARALALPTAEEEIALLKLSLKHAYELMIRNKQVELRLVLSLNAVDCVHTFNLY
jgi:hypothetical protein